MSISGKRAISKGKAGFSLVEMLVAMLIVSVVMAASLPLITLRKTSLGTHKQTDACIVNEAGNTLSDACQKAIADCKYNRGNSCATVVLLTLNATHANTAKSVLKEACIAGSEKACDYFIEQCAGDNTKCAIGGTDNDLRYFLAINANDPGEGKAYIYSKVKKWFIDHIPNIEAEVIAACTAYPNGIACKILSQKIYNFNRFERDEFYEQDSIAGTTFNDGIVTLTGLSVEVDYGPAYCWGHGINGSLGDNNTTDHSVGLPAVVEGNKKYSTISVGQEYTCGIEQGTNDAYCWGEGEFGKLGDNNTAVHNVGLPQLVQGGRKFTSISAASFGVSNFTCAIEQGTNDAYCWGQGEYGALGDNNTAVHNVGLPQIVQGSKKFSSISVGENYTCGIEQGTNDAYCWGEGEFGKLGDNNTAAHNVGLPTIVQGSRKFTSIVLGGEHACALEQTTNDAYCWGQGWGGRLGDNNTDSHNVGLPVIVAGNREFSSIASGGWHTCGVEKETNDVYCWGYGADGKLGDNNTDTHYVGLPGIVQGNIKFSTLYPGNNHTCAVEVTSNYSYCWGIGWNGRLGDNILGGHNVGLPGIVQGSQEFTFVSGGLSHTCGIVTYDPGAATSYLTTTDTNHLSGATKVLSVVITQTSDANSPVKWLVSFDGRTTWKKMTGVCTLEAATLDFSTSNTATEIQNWVKGCDLAAGTFDLAMDLQSTDGVTFPTVDKVLINYY
ncbi:MAG: hypothetical protein A2Y25_11715 [Candidatus Melainabacteria bacterium GWF2_37_15]|nr:MAG: hypothetical protein A2Y25_11715 [Candidatus Melainabacteria bacterium GWF2_37_15]